VYRSPSSLSLAAVPVDAHAGLQESLHADVWHAHSLATPVSRVVATGQAVLDAQLPGGGWPVGALTELLQAPGVHSEWRLLAPALARCGTAAVVLVAPPYVPFAPALAARGVASPRLLWVHTSVAAQRLWATEQALRCAGVDAVLAWLPQARPDQLRRLQMAASEYNRLLFVMRPSAARQESSPAMLRLALEPGVARTGGSPRLAAQTTDLLTGHLSDHLRLQIVKRRGPPLEHDVWLPACDPGLARLLAALTLAAPNPTAPGHTVLSTVTPPFTAQNGHALDRAAA
jgi:protein ImuA